MCLKYMNVMQIHINVCVYIYVLVCNCIFNPIYCVPFAIRIYWYIKCNSWLYITSTYCIALGCTLCSNGSTKTALLSTEVAVCVLEGQICSPDSHISWPSDTVNPCKSHFLEQPQIILLVLSISIVSHEQNPSKNPRTYLIKLFVLRHFLSVKSTNVGNPCHIQLPFGDGLYTFIPPIKNCVDLGMGCLGLGFTTLFLLVKHHIGHRACW